MKQTLRIALAGNPNSGKTSVFNAITGSRHHVGNYPGVTVEKKQGRCRRNGTEIVVDDLPGTYSLSAYSVEEIIARQTLIDEHPDAVVCVVDASNLERNLYLFVQLKEMGAPLVLALNMIDVAESRGLEIDLEALSRELGVPVIPTVGHRGRGVNDLLDAAIAVGSTKHSGNGAVSYGADIEEEIDRVRKALVALDGAIPEERRRWVALKLIENDENARKRYGTPEILAVAGRSAAALEEIHDEPPEIIIGQARYRFIEGVCDRTLSSGNARRTKTSRIDAVMTHRVLGLPIFFGLMYLVFQLTFTAGAPMMDVIESGFTWLGNTITQLWPVSSGGPLRSLVVDGVIGGVGGIIVFLPNILLLFLAISLLESSGYMARAAFIMDRAMRRIGLHGKSFIPMLIGFGCSIPAIMATRTLDDRRDRLTTMLVIPLISCSARLPIYLLIIPAFFPQKYRAPMLFLIYIIGIVIAVVSAKLLRTAVFKGQASPFLMELPPYRVPTAKLAMLEMWDRARIFLRKAGTMILGVTVILWALTTFPVLDTSTLPPEVASNPDAVAAARLDHSAAGRIGHAMEPLIRPLGFDWKIGTALIGAFAAKEVFVSQMGVVYSVGNADEESVSLRERLRSDYAPLVALCIMLFTLISSPCLATVAVTRRESNSWRWSAAQFWGLTAIAYIVTALVYNIGSALGFG